MMMKPNANTHSLQFNFMYFPHFHTFVRHFIALVLHYRKTNLNAFAIINQLAGLF